MRQRFFRRLASFLIATLAFCNLAYGEDDKKRIALVIGNSAYKNVSPLANPANDARDMTAALRQLDFEVLEGIDLDLNGLRRISQEFSRKTAGAQVALFFYAGHGVQVNKQNFIVPVDATLKNEGDLDFEALPMDLFLRQLERNAQVGLIFFDACRDNPFAPLWRAGGRSSNTGRGLARVSDASGLLISFATQPDNIAQDGDGRNSPFTKALLRHIGTPGASINDIMIEVRKQVIAETGNKQVPWETSSLTAKFYFKQGNAEITVTPSGGDPKPAGTQPAPSSEVQKFDPLAIEHAFWTSIQASNDAALFREYLEKFPKGTFTSIARSRLAKLETETKATPNVPELVTPNPAPKSAASRGSIKPCPDAFLPWGKIGTELTCYCDDSKLFGSIYGTGIYTSYSKVCAAALHAGVVAKGGGVVSLKGIPGARSYTGTRRNGITSNTYGRWRLAYRFTSGVVQGADNFIQCPNNLVSMRGTKAPLTCICPASSLGGGTIWGTGTYTDESIICRAALHAGAVPPAGGTVTVVPAPGLRSYLGTERNGVKSSNFNAFKGSFRFMPKRKGVN